MVNKIFGKIGKYLPEILTGLGVGGTIVTAVLSARGHVKAVDILKAAENESDEPLEAKDKVKKTWKCYVPAFASGVLTIACIVCSNRVSAKSLAALGAASGYLVKNRDALKEKLMQLGKKVDETEPGTEVVLQSEDQFNIMRDIYRIDKHGLAPTWEYTGKGTLRCVDLYSGRCFLSSKEAVVKAGQGLNNMLIDGCAVCLSDWYSLLGIRKTTFGFDYGWPNNEDYFSGPIHFEYEDVVDDDGIPILFIDIWTPPMDCWEDL